MTEIGTVVSGSTAKQAKEKNYQSIGKLLIGEGKIVDENLQELSYDTEGELMYSGSTVIEGYWEKPIDFVFQEGKKWFLTGDLMKKDREGFLYFLGRKKNIIKIFGITISPQDLESFLLQNPEVKEAYVFKIKDAFFSERIACALSVKNSDPSFKKTIVKSLKSKLKIQFSIVVEFFPSLPRGPLGKIKQNEIQGQVFERLGLRSSHIKKGHIKT